MCRTITLCTTRAYYCLLDAAVHLCTPGLGRRTLTSQSIVSNRPPSRPSTVQPYFRLPPPFFPTQGTASGMLWNDTVDLAGRSLDNVTFALCNQVSDSLLRGNASGIMGRCY